MLDETALEIDGTMGLIHPDFDEVGDDPEDGFQGLGTALKNIHCGSGPSSVGTGTGSFATFAYPSVQVNWTFKDSARIITKQRY